MAGLDPSAVVLHDPKAHGSDLPRVADWLEKSRPELLDRIHRHGFVLLRSFPARTASDFRTIANAIDPALHRYMGQTDRAEVQDRIYESTPVPGRFPIPLHSESAYSAYFPRRGLFFCERPADTGGESWLADTRKVLADLPAELVAKFESRGVRYIRNAPPAGAWVHRLSRLTKSGIVKSWPETFGETDREKVTAFGRDHAIPMQWKEGNWLSLDAVLPALRTHPVTGEKVWFNQAHLYRLHSESHPMLGRIASFLFNRLPPFPVMDSRFGDDEEIPSQDLGTIRNAFHRHQISIPLAAGDILYFDNLLVAHGRSPFRGKRRILATFSDYVSGESLGDR